ncbi:MAG: hypothetical protein COB02_16955 [Candidatus Cloacimonadota bacterium]|nr:MAG: hypothetical protein COB02_16955 [Candidatus Cloacimonadota bacterium]
MLFKLFLSFSLIMPLCAASPSIENINRTSPTQKVQDPAKVKRPDWEHSLPTMLKALELIDQRLNQEFPRERQKKGVKVTQHFSVRSIQNISKEKDDKRDTTAIFAFKFSLTQAVTQQGGTRYEVNRFMKNLQNMAGSEQQQQQQSQESDSRVIEKLYKIKFLSQPAYQALMPIASKISKSESQEVSVEATSESQKRYDVSKGQANWEHSKEAMMKAINMMIFQLSKKFPLYAFRDGVRFHNTYTIEAVENITPKELNIPDEVPPNMSFYQIQNGLDNLISVFLFTVEVKQTNLGQAYPNQQQNEDNDNDKKGDTEKLKRIYLMSFPKQPFHRKSRSSISQMLNAGMKAANLDTNETKITYANLKAQFPSHKVKVKRIKSESDLKKILSGKSSDEEESN